MSTVSRLWKRAPLWRLCVYATFGFSALACAYPPPYLLHAVPALARWHHAAPPAPDAQGGGQAAAPSDGAQNNPDRAGLPPITTSLSGSLPLAGHLMPLPAGIWHPVIVSQVGVQGGEIENVYVRADRGVVTGVIVVHANTRPAPNDALEALEAPCHDDRNLLSENVPTGDHAMECWYAASVLLRDNNVSPNPLINAAFARLRTLGFPIPPLMINTVWNRADADPSGGIDLQSVSTLLAPTEPGGTVLRAPIPYWDKSMLSQASAAQRFVAQTGRWMRGWAPILRAGYQGKLSADQIPERAARDPAAD